MPKFYAIVTASTMDFDSQSSSSSTIVASRNNSVLPSTSSVGKISLDTLNLPTGITITAATFHWFDHSYSTSPKLSQHRLFSISPDNSSFTAFYSNTTKLLSGWKSHQLTSGETQNINTTGLTWIKQSVNDPGGTKFRTWEIRSWDYGTGSSISNNDDRYSPYLEIDYEYIQSTGETGTTNICISYPTITMTKGWLGAATSLYSKGWLTCDIEIIEILPPSGDTGDHIVGFGSSRDYKRKQKLRKKKIIVKVFLDGKTYEKSAYVNEDVKITANNVFVTKDKETGDVSIKIIVNGVEID